VSLNRLRCLVFFAHVLFVLTVLLPSGLMAQQYTYVDINFPGASYTTPTGVNDSGKVVGYWEDNNGHVHGFYWDGANYTNLDYPGATDTEALGINNAGEISGWYYTDENNPHGFTLSDGTYSSYDYPGYAGFTNGAGLNNNGETTGYYFGGFGANGFFNRNGTFSSFSYPGAQYTHGYALNDFEQAVGDYQMPGANGALGFFYANNSFTSIEFPGDSESHAMGISNAGVVAGYSALNGPPFAQGWLWQSGTLTALTDSLLPLPYGINNNGQLVGIYGSKPSGFLATPAGQRSQLIPTVPCRVVDTRNPNGDFGGPPITGGTSRSFALPNGPCTNLPPIATAYALNVTLVPINHQRVRYLTIWPTGQTQPTVSTMNSDGRTKANAAIVPAGTDEAVSVYVTDTSNVIIDIDGYFVSSQLGSGLAFYPLTPCRVADTRSDQYPQGLGLPHLIGGLPRDFPILNSSCIPSDVNPISYSFNLTAIPYEGKPMGYLEIWPSGFEPDDPVSTLNNPNAVTVANAAIATGGQDGYVTVYTSADSDLVIDINGYFGVSNGHLGGANGGLSLYPVTPCRVIDTRNVGNGQPFGGTLSPPVDVINSGCGIPDGAQAFVFNATAVPQPQLSYLTLWPDGQGQPIVSTLNATDGAVTSNMAIVPNYNGSLDAYARGMTQLILDISSYFAP
jgi:probable HAF family extracellular repeat protein